MDKPRNVIARALAGGDGKDGRVDDWHGVADELLEELSAHGFGIVSLNGPMDGVERIVRERRRHPEKGFTPEHDAEHSNGDLMWAALAYIDAARTAEYARNFYRQNPSGHAVRIAELQRAVPDRWPWHADWWKSSDDPVRSLEKAGALIAAEIDRLLALRETA